MRNTMRSVAMIMAILGALAGPGLTAPAWAAGERDVTIAQGIDAEFLDVQMTNNIVTLIVNTSIYDTLLTRDKQLQLVPNLALSYKLVAAARRVLLRRGGHIPHADRTCRVRRIRLRRRPAPTTYRRRCRRRQTPVSR